MLLALALTPVAQAIVNGQPTDRYRAVASLVAIGETRGDSFCSGTLVHERWVLTAAHCVKAVQDSWDQGQEVWVVFAADVYNSDTWLDYATIEGVAAHPDYVLHAQKLYNDVGVIKLEQPVTGINPLPLNDQPPSNDWYGEPITYVGFGVTTYGGGEDGVKRTVDVPFAGADEDFVYSYYGGDGEVQNICDGDSGGPALMDRGDGKVLVGVSSFSFNYDGGSLDCDREGAAGAAARVDAELDWIRDYVPPIGFSYDTGEETPDDGGRCSTAPGRGGGWLSLALLAALLRRRQGHKKRH